MGEESTVIERELLVAELHVALRQAFAQLPLRCQRLLTMLIEDPPVPYAEISARLGIPVGSIGPNRARCMDRLRRSPGLAALTQPDPPSTTRENHHGQSIAR
jgi:DNA-directed RNA polymerase specialized sigma24 family protein